MRVTHKQKDQQMARLRESEDRAYRQLVEVEREKDELVSKVESLGYQRDVLFKALGDAQGTSVPRSAAFFGSCSPSVG